MQLETCVLQFLALLLVGGSQVQNFLIQLADGLIHVDLLLRLVKFHFFLLFLDELLYIPFVSLLLFLELLMRHRFSFASLSDQIVEIDDLFMLILYLFTLCLVLIPQQGQLVI